MNVVKITFALSLIVCFSTLKGQVSLKCDSIVLSEKKVQLFSEKELEFKEEIVLFKDSLYLFTTSYREILNYLSIKGLTISEGINAQKELITINEFDLKEVKSYRLWKYSPTLYSSYALFSHFMHNGKCRIQYKDQTLEKVEIYYAKNSNCRRYEYYFLQGLIFLKDSSNY